MPCTLTTVTQSGLIAGFDTFAIVAIAWDVSYPLGGEVVDLSTLFQTVAYGMEIGGTLNDGGYHPTYVQGATTASGVIQMWGGSSGLCGPFFEISAATDLTVVSGQLWLFMGR